MLKLDCGAVGNFLTLHAFDPRLVVEVLLIDSFKQHPKLFLLNQYLLRTLLFL